MRIMLYGEFGKCLVAYFSFQSFELLTSRSMLCAYMCAYEIVYYILPGGYSTHTKKNRTISQNASASHTHTFLSCICPVINLQIKIISGISINV